MSVVVQLVVQYSVVCMVIRKQKAQARTRRGCPLGLKQSSSAGLMIVSKVP